MKFTYVLQGLSAAVAAGCAAVGVLAIQRGGYWLAALEFALAAVNIGAFFAQAKIRQWLRGLQSLSAEVRP